MSDEWKERLKKAKAETPKELGTMPGLSLKTIPLIVVLGAVLFAGKMIKTNLALVK